jgi:hypothetical protein
LKFISGDHTEWSDPAGKEGVVRIEIIGPFEAGSVEKDPRVVGDSSEFSF